MVLILLERKSLKNSAYKIQISGINGIKTFPFIYKAPFSKYTITGKNNSNNVENNKNLFSLFLLKSIHERTIIKNAVNPREYALYKNTSILALGSNSNYPYEDLTPILPFNIILNTGSKITAPAAIPSITGFNKSITMFLNSLNLNLFNFKYL